MHSNSNAAIVCFIGAIAWPWVVGALAGLIMSPLDQATQNAWCGMPHHDRAFLGHCAACWVGSAILAATALLLVRSSDNAHSHAIRRPRDNGGTVAILAARLRLMPLFNSDS